MPRGKVESAECREKNEMNEPTPKDWVEFWARFYEDTGAEEVVPRECVMEFARAMEMKMRQREYKGPWKNYKRHDQLTLLREEQEELEVSCEFDGDHEEISGEAVDVGVCAMMLWDNHTPGDREDGR